MPPLPEETVVPVAGLSDRNPGTTDFPLDREEAGTEDLPLAPRDVETTALAAPRAAAGTEDLADPRELELEARMAVREANIATLSVLSSAVGVLDRDAGTADLPLDREEAGTKDLTVAPRDARTEDLPAPLAAAGTDDLREAGIADLSALSV